MTEQIMIHQNKRAKKTARILKYVDMVVVVGETLTSTQILFRMNHNTGLPTKKGTVPFNYIPSSTTSLGMRLKMAKNYEMQPLTENNNSYHVWRRVE